MVNQLRILVANEPRSYREAIARVFEDENPHAKVAITEQEELEPEVERFAPHLLICSRLSPAMEGAVLAWIELYPGHGPSSRMSLGGEAWTVAGMDLTHLLLILDRVESLLAEAG